jgi:exonuclease III
MPSSFSTSPLELRLGTWNAGLGFLHKLTPLLHRCIDLQLDVVAVQEIGDPALLTTTLSEYQLIYSAGPSSHEAGVGLLLSQHLLSRCRTYKQSTTGRLAAAVLEYGHGKQLLIVSAYMPSGLDHSSPTSDKVMQAHDLYREITEWSRGMQHVIVMGDLNETMSVYDRFPVSASPSATSLSPIQALPQAGFIDCYRHFYPSPISTPGFTHFIDSHLRPVKSRLDYVWVQGFPTSSIRAATIDMHRTMRHLSHHRLLCVTLSLQHPLAPTNAELAPRRQLPNLRAAQDTHKSDFVDGVETATLKAQRRLDAYAAAAASGCCVADNIDKLASSLTSITRVSAHSHFPLTKSTAFSNKEVQCLTRRRRSLTQLLRSAQKLFARGHTGPELVCSPELVKQHRRCVHTYKISWSCDLATDVSGWMSETERFIRSTRTATRVQLRYQRSKDISHFDHSPAAIVHRMMQSDAAPAEIYSVVNSTGALTETAAELKECMAAHFEHVFSIPPPRPAPSSATHPAPRMLFKKDGIDPSWYTSLMADVTEPELLHIASDMPLISAPGEDGVSPGVWKLATAGSGEMRRQLCVLFNLCLSTSTFPECWKMGVIIPLVKDAKKERSMSNIRPITLQSCLGKMLSRLLAVRLARIFSLHPILNPSQRGFVNGGSTHKCIDELVDAWKWSRENAQPLYTLFYDIKQAYDSVETDVLLRALLRLHLPSSFIALIANSLTGLTSHVRTLYGVSRSFQVQRSLRQGDPLAPLLFVILVDPLHDGMHTNPFSNLQHGLQLTMDSQQVYLPSLGFADDTNTLSNSLSGLAAMHHWMQYFMRFNRMRLNAAKCEVVGTSDGRTAVTTAELAHHGIEIEGTVPSSLPLDHSTRYLGVHASYSGSWADQRRKSLAHIMLFTRIATKFSLPIAHIVYMFNVFLLPKLEHAFRYCSGPGMEQWVRSCDRMLVGSIKHAARSPIRLSHKAVALTLGLRLPSWLETSIKVSELFIRANTADQRWAQLGRMTMRRHIPSASGSDLPPPSRRSGADWQACAVSLAGSVLHWSMQMHTLTSARRAALPRASHGSVLQLLPISGDPMHLECSSTSIVSVEHTTFTLAQDIWCGFGSGLSAATGNTVHVYTDGSAHQDTSSWAVVIADEWLQRHFDLLPTDENLLVPAHVGGSVRIGSAISNTSGVYPAELQGIARALAMLPLTLHVHVHSDSQSSIAAVRNYRHEANERAQLRMAARPVLRLINHLCNTREAAGGSVSFSHVPAHTTHSDIDSVGNRLADYQANVARADPGRTEPHGLQPMPLEQCEPHLCVKNSAGRVIIDDMRRTAMKQLKQQALEAWCDKPWPTGLLAGEGSMALGKVVSSQGSPELQSFLVHLATNSIHYRWSKLPDSVSPSRTDRSLHTLQCVGCDATLDLSHLVVCKEGYVASLHTALQQQWIDMLEAEPLSQSWASSHRHTPFLDLLDALFSPPTMSAPSGAADFQQLRHHVSILCGAFSSSAQSRAIRLLCLSKCENATTMFRNIRISIVQTIRHFFAQLHLSIDD